MTSKNVSSLVTLTRTELNFLLKLVQMVCHSRQFEEIDVFKWSEYCIVSFNISPDDAASTIGNLRKRANRELRSAELEL